MYCRNCGNEINAETDKKCLLCQTAILAKDIYHTENKLLIKLLMIDKHVLRENLFTGISFIISLGLTIIIFPKYIGGVLPKEFSIVSLVFLMTAFAITFVLQIIFLIIISITMNILKRFDKCPHGIYGGYHFDNCYYCRANKDRVNKLVKEKQKENAEKQRALEIETERILKIKNDADDLYRKEMHEYKQSRRKDMDYLLSLDPYEFEYVVLDMFSKLGYDVTATPYSNDRGKDGIAYKDGKKHLIECKRYKQDVKIGRPMLQKFFAAIHEEKAIAGYFVTTTFFADTAYEYASNNKIKLVNGYKLADMMSEAFPESKKIFKVMCLECGEIVEFKINMRRSQTLKCKNGHDVLFKKY